MIMILDPDLNIKNQCKSFPKRFYSDFADSIKPAELGSIEFKYSNYAHYPKRGNDKIYIGHDSINCYFSEEGNKEFRITNKFNKDYCFLVNDCTKVGTSYIFNFIGYNKITNKGSKIMFDETLFKIDKVLDTAKEYSYGVEIDLISLDGNNLGKLALMGASIDIINDIDRSNNIFGLYETEI